MSENGRAKMPINQAMALLADLGEWEARMKLRPDPPPGWFFEIAQAVQSVREYLAEQRQPCPPFVMSRVEHKANGSSRAYSV